jgi:phosphoribosylamine--glycine ligase
MNVLLIGSGGREHAMAWKLAQSTRLGTLFIAPGNPGTAAVGKNVAIDWKDPAATTAFCRQEDIALVIIGPEDPLVAGLADHLRSHNIPVVGPGKAGAQLEGSKQFSKAFMERHGIPTAQYRAFGQGQLAEALAYVGSASYPLVVKADGLAAGKGVVICNTRFEAETSLRQMMGDRTFGEAGSRVVVEQFLEGIEVSVFVLTDGQDYVLLPAAKDYKKVGVGDTGPNTGGMGSVSPVPFVTPAFLQTVQTGIVEPTLLGLVKEGIPYQGFLFIGLMVVQGKPFVLEYNVRMGDPETQSIMPRIKSDFLDLLYASATGKLRGQGVVVTSQACVSVVCVSEGYPGHYDKGYPITGLDAVNGSLVFHAGTTSNNGQLVTNGGRVLAVTSLAPTLPEAAAQSLQNAQHVHYNGKFYRTDIAHDLMQAPRA